MNDATTAPDVTFAASYLESTRAFKPILICFPACNGDGLRPAGDEAAIAAIHAEVDAR